MAMNAYRNYNTNTSALSKNLEKLSSGYRINRAGDDAAGLAISEKMRAQISGLEQASNNVGDGISLVQTAEGALQEVQDMLNRMVTLSEESANGTYQDAVDRENLQSEMDALKEEINRIADSANFNGINLLDGSMATKTALTDVTDVSVTAVADGQHSAASQAGVYKIDLSQVNFKATGSGAQVKSLTIGGAKVKTTAGATVAVNIATGGSLTGASYASQLNGAQVTINKVVYDITASNGILTLTGKTAPTSSTAATMNAVFGYTKASNDQGNGQSVTVTAQAVPVGANKMAQGTFNLTSDNVKDGGVLNIGGTEYTFKVGEDSTVTGKNVIDLTSYDGKTDTDAMLLDAAEQISRITNDKFIVSTTDAVGTSGVQIDLTEKVGQVDYAKDWNLAGATASNTTDADWTGVVTFGTIDTANSVKGLTLQIGDTSDAWNQMTVSINDMHTSSLKIDDISISTQSDAAAAISVIKDAINYVSSTRGTLGATQNRLEHTANNLSVMTENIQDAESTIRDTDIADEMTAYTKNQILVQSAQAMLAQANSVPQGVLQLLQ
jgi:flagellin